MFGFGWIVVGLLCAVVGAVRADLGLNQEVPDLAVKVEDAIGLGVEPLLEVNTTIEVDPALDPTGALGAIVGVINVVNGSIGEVFAATGNAVMDSTGPPNSVFSHVFRANINAEINMQNAIASAVPLRAILRKSVYQAIEGNLSVIQNQIKNLTSVYTELGAAANTITLFPNRSRDISTEITPKLVNRLAAVLGDISSKVANLADLFPDIVMKQIAAVGYFSAANATTNSAVSKVRAQLNMFNSSISTTIANLTATAGVLAGNISQAYVPITSAAQNFNGGDISNLTAFLELVDSHNNDLVQNITLSMVDLQDYIAELLANETRDATGAVCNGIRNLTDSALLSVSDFSTACSNRYQAQLQRALLQVNRLASCPESTPSEDFYSLLNSLLTSVRTDSVAITASQILGCSNTFGACSSTYFSVFPDLGEETHIQLQMVHNAIVFKIRALALRIGTCAEAVTADVQEIVQQIVSSYAACLETGN
ncbi:conserved hypothetical protein [Culex quinquefasciatus]|uniref:Uncharacterized protein n=1 Tax=Culex quinquefasciatus TaxID=7176 RepID=B0WCT5_CULQU|nr:conserved hypothetical protein [Culex quinquefasciatus]|eukprot:XP_001846519.1 conserved hypothetical protein [Culex quinquefasciatus]